MKRAAVLVLATLLFGSTAWAQTCNHAGRTIALVMDASGSMNARLPNGETRIEVAKRAIKGVAALVPAEARLSLRLYGAQSPSSRKNCEDTNLVVPSGPARATGSAIAAGVDAARAQGYTPIAYSLGQAANDFPTDAKERVVVLISDGKETCQGDPVLAARALAAKGITVHTIGFVVDTAARSQLQNIARITGGTYFDAPVGPELPDTLKQALNACAQRVVTLPPQPKPGRLRTTSATYTHDIFNSETGQKVDQFSRVRTQVELPAGIYEVKFGPGSWKGIEVRPGETTTIEPAVLKVEIISKPTVFVHATVVDSETGETHGNFDPVSAVLTLMPGVYDLRFAKAEWRFIKVDGGKTVTLRPAAVILAEGLKWKAARVLTQDGTEVFRFNAVTWRAAVPPGDYVVEIDGNKIPFPATEGEVLVVKPQ